MAELITADNAKRKGNGSKKKSTKVDLTPMVDLGFLLITFFIFTTTMCQSKVLGLDMPHDGKSTPIKNSAALTILLGANNEVFYYEGELQPKGNNVKTTSFKEIRNVIIEKKRTTDPKFLYIIIKPTDGSNYRNVVDMLDEMTVNVIKSYSIGDVDEVENKLVKLIENQ